MISLWDFRMPQAPLHQRKVTGRRSTLHHQRVHASPSKMVYDWENKEEICYRMYIEEKKSLEEIMEYMKEEFKFTPS
jgi:hypothetical protein